MPRDGAIIFADLIGKLAGVVCDKCGAVISHWMAI
jgi:hypothetical protein